MRASAIAVLLLACNSTATPNVIPDTATQPVTSAPGPATVIAPRGEGATAPAGKLRFVWTDFHFELGGTAVLEVEETRVTDLFPASRPSTYQGQPVTEMYFRLTSYKLSDAELALLRDALSAEAFWALDARYMHPSVEDGTTQTFSVFIGSDEKDVYCYHEWPEPVQRIREAIKAIQAAHQAERDRAPDADAQSAEALRQQAQDAGIAAGRKPG